MSIKATTYVWDHYEGKGPKLTLMLALADNCNDQGWCFPSVETLRHRCRYEDGGNVRKLLRELEKDGEIIRDIGGGRGSAGKTTNGYYLVRYRASVNLPPCDDLVGNGNHLREHGAEHGPRGAEHGANGGRPASPGRAKQPSQGGPNNPVREGQTTQSGRAKQPSQTGLINPAEQLVEQSYNNYYNDPGIKGSTMNSENDSGSSGSVSLADVYEAYQQNFGLMSSIVAEQLGDSCDTFSPEWVLDAMKIAVKQENRRLAYVEGILKRWRRDGKTDTRVKSNVVPPGEWLVSQHVKDL